MENKNMKKNLLMVFGLLIAILSIAGCIGQTDKFSGTWIMDMNSIPGALGAHTYKIEKIENSSQYKVHLDVIDHNGKVTPGGDVVAEGEKDNKDSNILRVQNQVIIYDPKEKTLEIPYSANFFTGQVLNAKFKKTTKDEAGIIEEVLPTLKENYEKSDLKKMHDTSMQNLKNYDGSKNLYKEK